MTQLFYNFFILITATLLCVINFSNAKSNVNQIEKIFVVYPKKDQIINPQNNYCLILGRVDKSVKELKINGEKVEIYKNGSFLHYSKVIINDLSDSLYKTLPKYLQAYFLITLLSENQIDTIKYPVLVPKPLRTLPENELIIDENFEIQPDENLTLNPGEIFSIKFKATPNCKATFTIESDKCYPMVETILTNQFYLGEAIFGSGFVQSKDTIRGIYEGCLVIPDADWQNKNIYVTLDHPSLGKKDFKLRSTISINRLRQPKVVKILYEPNLVIGRTGPMLGYKMFLPEGVKAIYVGEKQGFYKLKISRNTHIFVPKSSAEILPEGTPPPKSTIEVIRVQDYENQVLVQVGLHEKLPYEIDYEIETKSLIVKIYGATSNIDWIYFDQKQSLINNIKWNQLNDDELELKIYLNQKQLWGYNVYYDGTVLNVQVKKTPTIEKRYLFFGKPLRDKVIVLDPGHNPEDGAVGPQGMKEKDINLELAILTKDLLEKEGAKVYLTRVNESLPLRERKSRVLSFNPDVSISIHNNAVPDGVDPRKHNGLSVYWYNQNARELAYKLHDKLRKNLNVPDFGIYWDNLYMCRIPETIAVLVEPVFIIHPEQEELLRQKEFKLKIAKSIRDALIEFFEEARE